MKRAKTMLYHGNSRSGTGVPEAERWRFQFRKQTPQDMQFRNAMSKVNKYKGHCGIDSDNSQSFSMKKVW